MHILTQPFSLKFIDSHIVNIGVVCGSIYAHSSDQKFINYLNLFRISWDGFELKLVLLFVKSLDDFLSKSTFSKVPNSILVFVLDSGKELTCESMKEFLDDFVSYFLSFHVLNDDVTLWDEGQFHGSLDINWHTIVTDVGDLLSLYFFDELICSSKLVSQRTFIVVLCFVS